MRCPECETECPEQAKFCMACGARLARACPECGTKLPAGAKFCLQCGACVAPSTAGWEDEAPTVEDVAKRLRRLVPKAFADRLLATGGETQGERRVVTILFCDITGSTAIAEELDPEDVMEIMDRALDVLIEPIYRYEGTLARLMGDAVLAFFGAPIAHEDDPERACRAALDIVNGARGYAEDLELERGIRGFNVRVGINTGLVVVGEVGSDLRIEYTAMGDAINLASRMEQHAPPGGILITHDTYRHVRGVFDVAPQEPLTVKGKRDPVRTYLVERAKPQAFHKLLRGVEGVETPMVGRMAELLRLQEAYLDAIQAEETRLVTIVGEAGIGKTRLLDEFDKWSELRPERFWFFEGHAFSASTSVSYSLWRSVLSNRFEILESDAPRDALRKLRAGMAGVLEPSRADLVGQLVGFDFAAVGSQAVQRLLGSPRFGELARAYLVQYVRGMLSKLPIVMLLEDLHWADDSSLDMLATLAAEMPRQRALIIATARPTLLEQRPSWGEGLDACSRLHLRPLSTRMAQQLVEEILVHADAVPDELRDVVVEATEGNPLYVEELIKILMEDDVIVPGPKVWRIDAEALRDVPVPSSMIGILQARLDRLPLEEKAVLQRASVMGQTFWDRAVESLFEKPGDRRRVEVLLGRLRGRELVFRRERSSFRESREYVFKHALLRDVAYETLLRRDRRRYHARVAHWLEQSAGERVSEYWRIIAHHHELGGADGRAATYLRCSGDALLQVSAFRDAAQAYERALALLPGGREPERAAVQTGLGKARTRLGDYETASDHFERALALAEQIDEPEQQVTALCGLGEAAWWRGAYDAAAHHLERALPLARAGGDRQGIALVLWNMGYVALRRDDLRAAARCLRESLAIYRDLDHRQGVADALKALGIVAHIRGDDEEARSREEDSLRAFRDVGNLRGAASCLIVLGEVDRHTGRLPDAEQHYRESLHICREIGFQEGVCINLCNLGLVKAEAGQFEAACRFLREGLKRDLDAGSLWGILGELTGVALLRSELGQPMEAAELVGLVLHHPSSGGDNKKDARRILATLRQSLPPVALDPALARGAQLDPESVARQLLEDESWVS